AGFQAAGHQVFDQLGHSIRVGRGRRCPVHRFLEPRSRDQLHRPRDFADVADAFATFIEDAWIGHEEGVWCLVSGSATYTATGSRFTVFFSSEGPPAANWVWNSLIAASTCFVRSSLNSFFCE